MKVRRLCVYTWLRLKSAFDITAGNWPGSACDFGFTGLFSFIMDVFVC